MSLESIIREAIQLLKDNEELALKLNPDGYYVAFSGGKDSQAIYELCKMAGVKFKAHFNCTTVDPKEVLHFIHKYYPDVIWHRPEKSMFKLIKEHHCLPLRQMRFCCRLLKESSGVNNVVIVGVRASESRNRAKREKIEHQCIKGEDKIVIKPIFNWTNAEVWDFIRNRIGYYCELYDRGYHRIGCVLCPMASPRAKSRELTTSPRFEYAYKKAIRECIEYGNYKQFDDENDVFTWWVSGKSMKKYIADKKQGKLNF